jgi:hypothetical protein
MLNGRSHVVVGVLPPRVAFPSVLTHIYAPHQFHGRRQGVARQRLSERPGAAAAELRTIAASLAAAYPREDTGIRMGAEPLQQNLVGYANRLLLVLWAAVGF